MGRSRRTELPGTRFHVFNRGVAHQAIYLDDRDRVDFERLLGVVSDRFDVVVHSYCLMGNHYHLLVEAPQGGLSEAMHVLGSNLARHVNDRAARDGPLFKGRFSAKPVLEDEYFLWLVRYIHRNPLAFLDEGQLRSYRWSSLRALLGQRNKPAWLETDVVLSLAGGPAGFESLVFDGDSEHHGALPVPAWPDVIRLVLEERFESVSQRTVRTVATLMLDRVEPANRTCLARLLDHPTNQAERSALSRARRRARDQPELVDVVDEVLRRAA